ncbi:LOW QUALITY PROTEIN: myotubularin-related protein 7a [Aulostomus maculatus]
MSALPDHRNVVVAVFHANLQRLPSTLFFSTAWFSGCSLLIHCKNFQVLHFVFPQEQECHNVHLSLQPLSQSGDFKKLCCFSHKPNGDEFERRQEWDSLDLKADHNRMVLPNCLWNSSANQHYKVITYPADLFVPESGTPAVHVGSSKFRGRGRFPLSNDSKENHAAICRSSQPLSGFSARWLKDEQMLEAILRSNPHSDFIYVVDTRPKFSAIANQAAGKGYNEDNYSNIKFQFISIENIHVMSNSQQKRLEMCELHSPSMSNFLEGLESSGWLKHIKAVLDACIFIAKAGPVEGVSTLVHCSVLSLLCGRWPVSCDLLDPYYRTLGFMVLVEKDWLSFGQSALTGLCNHVVGDPKEVFPIVDQFLECVWQLMEQFPCAFEFNERFLITIHGHIYCCQYGNFIGKHQQERIELGLFRTHSLWSYLWSNQPDYVNPLYRPDNSQTQGPTAPYCFKYRQFAICPFHPKQADYLRAIQEETQQLEEQLASQKQKLTKLEQVWSVAQKTATFDKSPTAWVQGNDVGLAHTPQDYTTGFITSSPSQPKTADSCLILLQQDLNQSTDPNHSNNSDQESGIADVNSLSPLSEDSTKDPHSDEAAYSAA